MKGIASEKWGEFEGSEIRLWKLANESGAELWFTNYGGRLVRAFVPDRAGARENVTLGWDTLAEYVADGGTFYGALVGRYGNRIGAGRFTLEGRTYQLECNNAPAGIPCGLHGGSRSFGLRAWKCAEEIRTSDAVGLVFEIASPDGEGGFPANVSVRVRLTWNDASVWRIEWEGTADAPTPLSFTDHAYWNLDGTAAGTTCLGNELQLEADRFTPYTPGMIPTGELRAVDGTPFDFRRAHAIGRDHGADDPFLKIGAGYDINWEVRGWNGSELRKAAALASPATGRTLEVWTTEPGVQVYDGYYLPVRNAGVALETQHYPDSPNRPEFPTTIVRPGEVRRSVTEYRFGVRG